MYESWTFGYSVMRNPIYTSLCSYLSVIDHHHLGPRVLMEKTESVAKVRERPQWSDVTV